MKIIISPTKTLKRKNYQVKKTVPKFLNESLKLREILSNFSLEKLKKDFKLSDNLAKKTYEYYQGNLTPISAINLYEGLAYKNMEIESYNSDDLEYLNKYVNILSAMYGVVKVSDEIVEYRLDYLNKFEIKLYDYWKDNLHDYFKKENLIINLASNEFSKSIKHGNMVNIFFLDLQGRNLSTNSKISRGKMLKFLVKNKITKLDDIKRFNDLNYTFDNNKSDTNNFYFRQK